jgi:hypothetical protein
MMKNICLNGMMNNITPLGFWLTVHTTDYNLFTPSALKYKLEI